MPSLRNLEQLQKDLTDVFDDMIKHINQAVVETAAHVGNELARVNPELTGLSEANWQGSKKRPVEYSLSQYGEEAGSAQREQAFAGYDYRRDGSLWITNNIHYMYKLDRGDSKKAPPGWILRTANTAFSLYKYKG